MNTSIMQSLMGCKNAGSTSRRPQTPVCSVPPTRKKLEFARQSGRVLFTQDADFLRLHRDGVPHAGVVYAVPGLSDIGAAVRFLCLLHDCVAPAEMQNAVEFLYEIDRNL